LAVVCVLAIAGHGCDCVAPGRECRHSLVEAEKIPRALRRGVGLRFSGVGGSGGRAVAVAFQASAGVVPGDSAWCSRSVL